MTKEKADKDKGEGVITSQVAAQEPVRLNLGAGFRKIAGGFINIDYRPETEPDLCVDVTEGLPFDDNSVDVVRAMDFLEHIPIGKVVPLMDEIWRVLKPGGVLESITPSTDGRGAFQDPTHKSFWNANSWAYYSHPQYRQLHGIKADFEIQSLTDMVTDALTNVIHTHVVAIARKVA